jgi:hypothetical protein
VPITKNYKELSKNKGLVNTKDKQMAQKLHNKGKANKTLCIMGKDEMNLVEFPFATLGSKDPRDHIVYEGWGVENGERQHRKWVASSSVVAGLPTEYGERVFIALLAITHQQGFQSRKVSFSVYRALKIMRVTTSKRDYQNFVKALEQLTGLTIHSENAFWDKGRQKRITTKTAFHLIEKFWIRYQEADEAIMEEEGIPGYIIWGEIIWNSLRDGYIKNLDLDFFYGLCRPLTRRLYRFLDRRMYTPKSYYEFDLYDLAKKMGMNLENSRKPADVRNKLKPALQELVEREFLKKFVFPNSTRVRVYKAGKGKHLEGQENELLAARLEVEQQRQDEQARQKAQLYQQYGTTEHEEQLWGEVQNRLSGSLSAAQYDANLKHSVLLRCRDQMAILGLADELTRDRVCHRLDRKIKEALNSCLKSDTIITVEYVVLDQHLIAYLSS